MISHAPSNYECPFCDWLAGSETPYKQNSDIIYQDEQVTAFVAPKWWINNPGGVIVIPNRHYENIYDIPDDVLCRVYKIVKRVALSLRNTYPDCVGTSTRQSTTSQQVIRMYGTFIPTYLHGTQTTGCIRTMTASVLLIPTRGAAMRTYCDRSCLA